MLVLVSTANYSFLIRCDDEDDKSAKKQLLYKRHIHWIQQNLIDFIEFQVAISNSKKANNEKFKNTTR